MKLQYCGFDMVSIKLLYKSLCQICKLESQVRQGTFQAALVEKYKHQSSKNYIAFQSPISHTSPKVNWKFTFEVFAVKFGVICTFY